MGIGSTNAAVEEYQALVLAGEAPAFYGNILTSTVSIIFMGTPHQGSELVPWALTVANIVNVAFVGQALRTDLIDSLKIGSEILANISSAFVARSAALKIMSFIEMEIERPLTTLVGDATSLLLSPCVSVC